VLAVERMVATTGQIPRTAKSPDRTVAGTTRGGFTIRQASADLPAFDEETSLEAVSSLGTEGGQICDFQFGDVSVPTLEVRNVQLAQALAAELDVTFGDDLSDRPEQP
jgi:hypothetical protein